MAEYWDENRYLSTVNPQNQSQLRVEVLEGTMQAFYKGCYVVNEEVADLEPYDMMNNRQALHEAVQQCQYDQLPDFDAIKSLGAEKLPADEVCPVQVVCEDCVDAAIRLLQEARENGRNEAATVLDMASNTEPGGFYMSGQGTQEQSLFWRSNLWAHFDTEQGVPNRLYPIPDQCALYARDVVFIRANENERGFAFIEPTKIDVVAIAALQGPQLKRNSEGCEVYADPNERERMLNIIRTILQACVQNGSRNIVLGALGCGFYRNPPVDVALCFRQALQEYGSYFRNVVFALRNNGKPYGVGNYETFRRIFEGFVPIEKVKPASPPPQRFGATRFGPPPAEPTGRFAPPPAGGRFAGTALPKAQPPAGGRFANNPPPAAEPTGRFANNPPPPAAEPTGRFAPAQPTGRFANNPPPAAGRFANNPPPAGSPGAGRRVVPPNRDLPKAAVPERGVAARPQKALPAGPHRNLPVGVESTAPTMRNIYDSYDGFPSKHEEGKEVSRSTHHVQTSNELAVMQEDAQESTMINPSELEKGDVLGRGTFGVVFRGTYRGQEVAIKELLGQDYMTDKDRDAFMREVGMMEKIRHYAIVDFLGAVLVPGKYSIVLEFCQYGSLMSAMKHHPEEFANEQLKIKCLVDAADAMEFLHRYDIIHRDLKPDNYLIVSLDPNAPVVAKLSDFGTTREVGRESKMQMTKDVGTPLFMAPEILKGSSSYGKSVDVYSFSLIMYYVFSGKLPFEDDPTVKNEWALSNAVISGKRPVIPSSCPDGIKELIQKCWSTDPYERPLFDQIYALLKKFLPSKLDPTELEKGELIGRGSFGVVFKGTYHGQEVAIKELLGQEYMGEDQKAAFLKEVGMMERLHHEAIVTFIGAVLEPGKFAIVSEFCQYGSLMSAMKHHPEEFTNESLKIKILVDAANAMKFLHGSNIIHRDLKPDNYLIVSLDSNAPVVAKLSDFGTSREVDKQSNKMQMTKDVGTPLFMAPEILKGSEDYDQSVDVYSFSLIMYYIFSGKLPFEDDPSVKNEWALSNAIISGKRPPIPESLNNQKGIQGLMKACWSGVPSERPTFDIIYDYLKKFLPKKLDPEEVKKGEMVGKGTFGVVFKGTYRGQEVAIKELLGQDYLTRDDDYNFKKEVCTMGALHHEAIVTFIGAILVPGKYAIVSEFCQYGSLTSAMKNHPTEFEDMFLKMRCLCDASHAMKFLHESNIIHRDLKPDNYLVVSLDPSHVCAKLSDFGTTRDLSFHEKQMSMTKSVGTPLFMAPEILKGSSDYGKPVDVYSFSLIVYYVFSGKLPFEDDPSVKTEWALTNAIISGNRPAIPDSCPDGIVELMQACWKDNPDERPSFEQIYQFLSEPFNQQNVEN